MQENAKPNCLPLDSSKMFDILTKHTPFQEEVVDKYFLHFEKVAENSKCPHTQKTKTKKLDLTFAKCYDWESFLWHYMVENPKIIKHLNTIILWFALSCYFEIILFIALLDISLLHYCKESHKKMEYWWLENHSLLPALQRTETTHTMFEYLLPFCLTVLSG